MVEDGIDSGREVVEDPGRVGDNRVEAKHERWAGRVVTAAAVDGDQTLGVEWRPTDEESHHHSNWKILDKIIYKIETPEEWGRPKRYWKSGSSSSLEQSSRMWGKRKVKWIGFGSKECLKVSKKKVRKGDILKNVKQ